MQTVGEDGLGVLRHADRNANAQPRRLRVRLIQPPDDKIIIESKPANGRGITRIFWRAACWISNAKSSSGLHDASVQASDAATAPRIMLIMRRSLLRRERQPIRRAVGCILTWTRDCGGTSRLDHRALIKGSVSFHSLLYASLALPDRRSAMKEEIAGCAKLFDRCATRAALPERACGLENEHRVVVRASMLSSQWLVFFAARIGHDCRRKNINRPYACCCGPKH